MTVHSQDADVVLQTETRQATLPFTPEVANHVQVSSSQNGSVQVIPIENGDAQVKEELLNGSNSSIAGYTTSLLESILPEYFWHYTDWKFIYKEDLFFSLVGWPA